MSALVGTAPSWLRLERPAGKGRVRHRTTGRRTEDGRRRHLTRIQLARSSSRHTHTHTPRRPSLSGHSCFSVSATPFPSCQWPPLFKPPRQATSRSKLLVKQVVPQRRSSPSPTLRLRTRPLKRVCAPVTAFLRRPDARSAQPKGNWPGPWYLQHTFLSPLEHLPGPKQDVQRVPPSCSSAASPRCRRRRRTSSTPAFA